MNETEFQQLLAISRRRALTPEEQARAEAWLARHPETRAAWEEERQLDELLRRLPDVPMSSNFTAQVLARVQRETAAGEQAGAARGGWLRWLPRPRLALTIAVLVLVPLVVWQARVQQRAQLAASVEALSGVAAVPTVEMLADFDAIMRLSRLPANSDAGVLTALQSP
jgi:anti-sigma factor RsiW